MAIADDLYGTIGNFNVCTKFELLKIKVPIITALELGRNNT